MSSLAVAQRASGGRCVVCNSWTRGGWYCDGHGVDNTFVSARVRNDYERPSRPRNAARFAASAAARITAHDHLGRVIAKRIGYHDNVYGEWEYGAYEYTERSPRISDPRRWCDDCIGYMRHRAGCSMTEQEGPFVGGYDSEADPGKTSQRFAILSKPERWWTPTMHRKHQRAINRRWDAFVVQWTKIALHVLADAWIVGKVMQPQTTRAART